MLQCIICGKIIIQNEQPKRYAVCSYCNVMNLTEDQKHTILRQKAILLKAKLEEMNKES